MKKVVVALLVLTASFLFVSCGAKQPPVMQKVEFGYEKGAVLLNLKADPQLNLYQGSPHTLSLCIYQLRDPNGFNQLAADLRPRTLVPLHLSKAYVRNPRALYRELAPPQATRLLELPDYVTARPLLLTELPRFDRSIRQADTLPCMEVPDD